MSDRVGDTGVAVWIALRRDSGRPSVEQLPRLILAPGSRPDTTTPFDELLDAGLLALTYLTGITPHQQPTQLVLTTPGSC